MKCSLFFGHVLFKKTIVFKMLANSVSALCDSLYTIIKTVSFALFLNNKTYMVFFTNYSCSMYATIEFNSS